MDLRQLEYFVGVAEERSFTRAAARCHVVQSALSYQIARLEREQGVTLFHRTSRTVQLAPAGELLLPHARRLLDGVDVARAELAAVNQYDKTPSNLEAARRKLADAEYELAEEKCDMLKGNEKDSCENNAKSVRTAALADAKAGRDSAASTTGGSGSTAATAGSAGLIASTDTKDPVKAAAVQKCEEKGSKTACLVENKGTPDTALERAGEHDRVGRAGGVCLPHRLAQGQRAVTRVDHVRRRRHREGRHRLASQAIRGRLARHL